MNRQEVGKLGEQAAQRFLKKQGYRIREKGFRCRYGEIDIIAQHRDCLVFVEVRAKTGADFGTPEESLTRAKKRRLVSLALTYASTHQDLPEQWRIDVVAVELDDQGRIQRIEVIENAVEQDCAFTG